MDAEVEYCKKNDKYGLYKLSEEGKLNNLAGVDEKYDNPEKPDVIITSGNEINIEEVIAGIKL